jgi:NitT/TauT family transport system permease protein
MTSGRMRSSFRAVMTLIVVGLIYEAIARTGYFPPVLMPSLSKIGATLWGTLIDGTMLTHAAYTMYRVMAGLALATIVGLPLGILMGRF